jgi:hypothetical protein
LKKQFKEHQSEHAYTRSARKRLSICVQDSNCILKHPSSPPQESFKQNSSRPVAQQYQTTPKNHPKTNPNTKTNEKTKQKTDPPGHRGGFKTHPQPYRMAKQSNTPRRPIHTQTTPAKTQPPSRTPTTDTTPRRLDI